MRGGFPLDERLSMLSALTPPCNMAADVGADHGFLGAALLCSGRCTRVQFLDISAQSLEKARRLIARLELDECALFSVGDGLAALRAPAQAVIIAGMGGPTIAGIIERGTRHLDEATLVMQPNVDDFGLRLRLTQLGFQIVEESLARAGGRYYVGIAARRGEARYAREELLAGPCLLRDGHPLLAGYASFRLRVLGKALASANGHDEMRAAQLAVERDMWNRIVRSI